LGQIFSLFILTWGPKLFIQEELGTKPIRKAWVIIKAHFILWGSGIFGHLEGIFKGILIFLNLGLNFLPLFFSTFYSKFRLKKNS